MKGSSVIHLLWAVIALGTFLLGSKFFGTENSREDTSGSDTPKVTQRSTGGRQTSPNRATDPSKDNDGSPRENNFITPEDIAQLGEDLRVSDNPISRRIAFSKILQALTPENALLLREQLAHLPEKSPEYQEFHYAWGRIAGEAAAAHCAGSPERDMAAALGGWANSDPEAALAHFQSLSPDDVSEYWTLPTGIANGLADNHPELAIKFVEDRLLAGDRYTVKLLNSVVDSLIVNHPPETLAKLTKELPGGDLLNSIGYKVVQHLSDSDPSQAYAWASSLPNGQAKYQGIGASFARWAGKDPEEAAKHLATVPRDQLNSAIYGFSSRAAYDDPVIALEWASTITVEKTRNSAVFDAGVAYFRKDPEAAALWLPNSGLPNDLREKLLAKVKK